MVNVGPVKSRIENSSWAALPTIYKARWEKFNSISPLLSLRKLATRLHCQAFHLSRTRVSDNRCVWNEDSAMLPSHASLKRMCITRNQLSSRWFLLQNHNGKWWSSCNYNLNQIRFDTKSRCCPLCLRNWRLYEESDHSFISSFYFWISVKFKTIDSTGMYGGPSVKLELLLAIKTGIYNRSVT